MSLKEATAVFITINISTGSYLERLWCYTCLDEPIPNHLWFCCQQANGDVLALKVLIVTYSQSCLLLQRRIEGRGPDDAPPPPLSEGLEPAMCYTLRTKITDYEYIGNLS